MTAAEYLEITRSEDYDTLMRTASGAALQAASRGGSPRPRIPGSHPYPGTGLPPLGDPPPGSPGTPGRTEFPRPPEIH